jgi:hypothetical protein
VKKTLTFFAIGFIVSALLALVFNNNSFNYDYLTSLGLTNLIFALLFFICGLIAFAFDNEIAKALLIASGLFLLIGTLTCTVFPFSYNN